MGNEDIILTRIEQKLCPICKAEFKPEWKYKFKLVQYKERAIYICIGHRVPE